MAKNDLILLDALLEKNRKALTSLRETGQLFEFFALDNLLKDYGLSTEEIESGWVDGGDDGGIDGLYTFVDGQLILEPIDEANIRKRPEVEVIVITCKHEDTFRQVPLNNLHPSICELFDLAKSQTDLIGPYNDDLLRQREIFCSTYKELAANQASIVVRYYYCSRGDTSQIAANIRSRANLIEHTTKELFSSCTTTFVFLGAAELYALAQKQRLNVLKLNFIENYVSRAKTNYLILCKLEDYYNFVTDEDGNLRRYLFESNVRDFMGINPVNQDIALTLAGPEQASSCDFWWLNNGVTIVAGSATVAGKELHLENIQIVNGLQTTETIFGHFTKRAAILDDRAILVKIIVTRDDEVRDKIIKATNFQTAVENSSLRATDKIQRDVEVILAKHNWFYDRRKNYYRNQGFAVQRIVSPWTVACAMYALVLKLPVRAARLKRKFMRIDSQYRQVFNPDIDVRWYPAAVEILKGVEERLHELRDLAEYNDGRFAYDFRSIGAFLWTVLKAGKLDYSMEELLQVAGDKLTIEEVSKVMAFITTRCGEFRFRGVYRDGAFFEKIKAELEGSLLGLTNTLPLV